MAGLWKWVVLYAASVAMGLPFLVQPEGISALWPPAGVLLAALLSLPRRRWPVLLAVCGGVLFLGNLVAIGGGALSAALTSANLLEGVLAAVGLSTLVREPVHFRRVRAWIALALVAPAAAVAGAVVGAYGVSALADRSFGGAFEIWWVSDTCGMLVLTPAVLAFAQGRAHPRRLATREGVALIAVLAAVAWIVLGRDDPRVAAPYLCLPFLLWASLRFDAAGAAVSSLLVATIAVVHTWTGTGPFAATAVDAREGLVSLQVFLGAVVLFAWLPSALAGELRRSESLNRGILDSLRAHIAMLAPDGTITGVNRAWEAFARTNDSPAVYVGANYFDVCERSMDEEPAAADALEGIRDVIEGRRALFLLTYECSSPEEERWFVMQVTRLEGASGVVVAHENITEEVLLREELRQTQKTESLGRLAGGIAHDFNNLITAMLGHVELIDMDLPPGHPATASLATVRESLDRAIGITSQLLAIARRHKGRPQVIDPNAIAREVVNVLSPTIGPTVTLDVALGEDLGNVRVDPGQLQQVLINLVVNARDAMPRGGAIRIRTRSERLDGPDPPAGRYVAIDVEDEGDGIPPDLRERIFEPFYTTKGERGTGLGLSTSLGIVKQAGGDLRVRSGAGAGTCFTALLPAVDDPVEGAAAEPALAAAVGSARVLVVDDDEVLRNLMERVLARAGYEVIVAADADEALVRATAAGALDGAVVDMRLPGMDGPELVRRLRGRFAGLPALMVSGHTATEVEADDRTAFLRKPFPPADLLRRLRELLHRP